MIMRTTAIGAKRTFIPLAHVDSFPLIPISGELFAVVFFRVLVFGMLGLALSCPALAQDPKTTVLDIHKLPLGDGKVSDHALSGFVYSCQQQFPQNAPGARVNGSWIHGKTWDLTEKLSVQGRVTWPNAQFKIETTDGGRIVSRVLTGNGLPVNTPTGTFPVAATDPAFQIDRNPNSILAQQIALTLPLNPVSAAQATCVSMGMIGVALNGVAIFNALDAGGHDAVAHEVQDLCSGHPEMRGQYHYHGPSPCLPNENGNEILIGYALDGFGIFSIYDANGREFTDRDLDECHGRTSEIIWDGKRVTMYHYVLTREYPYTIGCFRGTPIYLPPQGPPQGRGSGPPPGR
jgi:hypothetical protein